MRAWITQDSKQVKKVGKEKASWVVEWIDPEDKRRSKSCGPGARGKNAAEKLQRKIEAELIAGTYRSDSRKKWEHFRREFDERVLDGMEPRTRQTMRESLAHFERIVGPRLMASVTTKTIDRFIAERRKEKGRGGGTLSKATVNRDLRHIKACLRKAKKWGYLSEVPEFEFLREVKKLPTYVPPEEFGRIYHACDAAKLPDHVQHIAPVDWWQGLLVMAYMTGWRIGDLLALRWEDVDLKEGTAVTRGEENKGRRDELIALHPLVVEHLQRLKGFDPYVFPWARSRRPLYADLHRIQKAAGVRKKAGAGDAEDQYYSFHDLRRAFGTLNADRITADALQALMRHQSYTTTQRYINMARQMKPAVENLFVPELAQPEQADAGKLRDSPA